MKKLCLLLVFLLLLTGCGGVGSEVVSDDPVSSNWVSFDVYAINDLHGRLADTQEQPGLDELSGYLRGSGNAILLSTGDMWQGTSESNLTRGFIITEWMNEMGFTSMTLGGHEFDWGLEWLHENRQLADFPFLAINIYDRETDQQLEGCQSSVVVEMDGAQIGIIGAIGDCYSSISPEYSKDFYFKTGSDLTELVKAEATALRRQGVDFVIYTIHDGYDQNTTDTQALQVGYQDLKGYYDTTLSDGYVDLVFEADSHYWYVLQDEYGVYHLQGGGNNQGLSYARVMLNKTDGTATVSAAQLLPDSEYRYREDDPVVAELLEKYAAEIEPANKILGNNGKYRSGSTLCQIVAELYCAKGIEKWGEQYPIVLAGGYLATRAPGFLDAGQVSYRQLQSLFPFDNQITLCSISGRDLKAKFLDNDHHAYHIQTTPYGESIRHNIDPNGTYYVITDSYSAYYPYNRMTVIDTYDETTYARDLLAEYIAQGGLG